MHYVHVSELAANAIKYCSACKHFRHHAMDLSGVNGVCILFKKVNLVSADKHFVNAKLIRDDEGLCGRGAHRFEPIGSGDDCQ
jgi:hypothetical protein